VAINVGALEATLGLDSAQFSKGLNSAATTTKGFSRRLQAARTGSFALAGGMAALGAAFVGLTTFGFQQARTIQNQVAGIQALTKNSKEAGKVLNDMVEFVQGKPFDRLDAIGAAKDFLAMGGAVEDLDAQMDLLARGAVLGGTSLQDVGAVLNVVQSQGRAMTNEFNMMSARVPSFAKAMAEEFGGDMEKVREALADGEISAETFTRVLDKSLDPKIVEKAGNTIDQRLSSLSARFRGLAFDILGVDFTQIDGRPLVTPGKLLDKLIDGFEALTKFLSSDKLKGAFKGIGDAIVGAIDFLQKNSATIFGPFMAFLAFAADNSTAVAGAIGGALVPAFLAMASALWAMMAPLIPFMIAGAALALLAKHIIDNWDTIGPKIMPSIEQFVAAASDGFNLIVNDVVPALIEIFEEVVSVVGPIIDEITKFINVFVSEASDDISGFKTAFKTISAIIGDVVTFAKPLIRDISKFIVKNLRFVTDWVDENWPLIQRTITVVMNRVKAVWDAVWPVIKTTIMVVWEIIKEVVQTGTRVILGLIKGVMQLITGDWEEGWATIRKALWEAIKGIFRIIAKLVVGVVRIGIDIVKGIWKGILQTGGFLKRKIRKWIGDKIDFIKRLFRISSPSKVMEEIGEFITIGLAEGIASKGAEVTKALGGITSKLLGGLNGVIDKVVQLSDSLMVQKGTAEEVARAELSLQSAILAHGDAVAALNETNIDAEKNESDRRKALIAVQQAAFGVTDAQKALNDTLSKIPGPGVLDAINESLSTMQQRATDMISAFDSAANAIKNWKGILDSVDKPQAISADEMRKLELGVTKAILSQVEAQEELNLLLDVGEATTNEILKAQIALEESIMSTKAAEEELATAQQGRRPVEDLINNLAGQNDALRAFQNTMGKLKTKVPEDLFNELYALGPGALSDLDALAKAAPEKLTEFINQWSKNQVLSNQVGFAGAAAAGDFGEEFENHNFFKKPPENVVAFMDGLRKLSGTKGVQIGKNLVKGINEGIQELSNWLGNKIGGFGEKMIRQLKSVLGIASPSKEFAKIGAFMTEGLASGINNTANNPRESVRSLLKDNFNTLSLSGAQLAGEGGSGTTNTFNITINASGNVDGRGLAGDFMDEVRRMTRSANLRKRVTTNG